MYSKIRTFSHVYVEEAVLDHPRAAEIRRRLAGAIIVPIDHYSNLFNRRNQSFGAQKISPKLILAMRGSGHLYDGNDFLQATTYSDFRYNTIVMNCPYDCQYCFLQGMYSGANLVVFVNLEDYFNEVENLLEKRGPGGRSLRLAISYDTDLLALEGLLGFTAEWLEWSRDRSGIEIEVRTKSLAGNFVGRHRPHDGFLLAWTLTPEEVARRYEPGPPTFGRRMGAIQRAVEDGWRVQLCIDPVLRVPGWEAAYTELVDQIGAAGWVDRVERIEVGVFRVSVDYFARMQKRGATDLLQYPFEHASGIVSYSKNEREAMMSFLKELLRQHFTEEQIYLWT